MKILAVFGTRPEAIKMMPVVEELGKHDCDYRVCVTGQHRQMLDQILSLYDVRVHYDLNIMRANQDLTDVTVSVLRGVGEVLADYQPDWTIVQGDTTTAFATALAAFYKKIKVGHVEAGLRTGDIYSPWPEEMNRKLVTAMAALHFAPTETARRSLLREGIPDGVIHVTGNTVIDSLKKMSGRITENPDIERSLAAKFPFLDESRRMILVTGHRRESFGDGFRSICLALKRLAERGDVQIVYPVHLNPNVRTPVNGILGGVSNVSLIEPQGYLEFIYLMWRSYFIITDSGGVQEEAPSLGKPVLVIRETTERPEAIEAGTVRLIGTDEERIVSEGERLLDDREEYEKMAKSVNPYGDGFSAGRIVREVLRERIV